MNIWRRHIRPFSTTSIFTYSYARIDNTSLHHIHLVILFHAHLHQHHINIQYDKAYHYFPLLPCDCLPCHRRDCLNFHCPSRWKRSHSYSILSRPRKLPLQTDLQSDVDRSFSRNQQSQRVAGKDSRLHDECKPRVCFLWRVSPEGQYHDILIRKGWKVYSSGWKFNRIYSRKLQR